MRVIKREERYVYYSELINLFYPLYMPYHLNLNTSISLIRAIIKFNTRYRKIKKGKPNILQNDF